MDNAGTHEKKGGRVVVKLAHILERMIRIRKHSTRNAVLQQGRASTYWRRICRDQARSKNEMRTRGSISILLSTRQRRVLSARGYSRRWPRLPHADRTAAGTSAYVESGGYPDRAVGSRCSAQATSRYPMRQICSGHKPKACSR